MPPRRVTDALCLLIFVGCLAGMLGVVHYATKHGDLRRIHHGFDFLGNLCGVGDFDDSPFLFYCTSESSGLDLDLQHPICVAECPSHGETQHACYSGVSSAVRQTDAMTGSYEETLHYNFKQVYDYPTYVFMGRYCMPVDTSQLNQIKDVLADQYGSGLVETVLEITGAWQALILAFAVAFVAGFSYLYGLEHLAGVAVYVCLIVPCVTCSGVGFYLIALSRGALPQADLEAIPGAAGPRPLSTGDAQWDLYLGIVLAALGVAFGLVCCFCRQAVETAISCIEATCECMLNVPTLLLVPLISVGMQLIILFISASGFLLLLSCGKVEEESMAHYVTTPSDDMNVRGIMRSFEYRESEYYYIAFYIFMMVWMFEIAAAFCQFMLIYSVEIWYFVPYSRGVKRDIPVGLLMRGALLGFVFHLGSIAMGSFLIAVLRVARIIGHILSKQQEGSQNAVGAAIAKCCTCLVTCFERFVREINKSAYMHVAMKSDGFCEAASAAFKLLTGEVMAVSVLNGVTWVLQLAGIGTVSAVGAGVTYVLVRTLPWFSNPGQETYVPNPEALCVAAAVISGVIAWNFMMVFDTVSDTILFCFVTDQKTHSALFNWDTYAPPGLKKLMDKQVTGEVRSFAGGIAGLVGAA